MRIAQLLAVLLGSLVTAQQEPAAPAGSQDQGLGRIVVFELSEVDGHTRPEDWPGFVAIDPDDGDGGSPMAAAAARSCNEGRLYALVFCRGGLDAAMLVQDSRPADEQVDDDLLLAAVERDLVPRQLRRHAVRLASGRVCRARDFQGWPSPSGNPVLFEDASLGSVGDAERELLAAQQDGTRVQLGWRVPPEDPAKLALELVLEKNGAREQPLTASYQRVARDSASHRRALSAMRLIVASTDPDRSTDGNGDGRLELGELQRFLAANGQLARDRAEAKQLFAVLCATCHGAGGRGDGPGAVALDPKPRNYTDRRWQTSVTDDELRKIILLGGVASGKSPMMPANPQLRDKPGVVDALVEIVRGFGK